MNRPTRKCPFCDYAGPSPILKDFGDAFVIEPIDPVTEGHVLVIPKRHVRDALDEPLTTGRVMALAAQYAIESELESCNLITSVGASASQTIFHLHVHVVPRRDGDGLVLPWTYG